MKALLSSTKNKTVMIIMAMLIVCLFILAYIINNKNSSFICDGTLTIRKEDHSNNVILSGVVNITMNFTPNNFGYVSESGYIDINNTRFGIDRYITINSKPIEGSGFYNVERVDVVRNPYDSLPMNIDIELSSAQKILNLRFYDIKKNTILISDLRRVLLACNKR